MHDAQILRQELDKAEDNLKQYMAVQRSSHHTRVGKSATTILDGQCHRLSQVAIERKRDYEKKLTDLIQLEESFDLPIQCLAKKQRDLKDMKAELLAMKKYLRDVETWKESTQKILGELVRSGTVL